jgi:hypothetical protein
MGAAQRPLSLDRSVRKVGKAMLGRQGLLKTAPPSPFLLAAGQT